MDKDEESDLSLDSKEESSSSSYDRTASELAITPSRIRCPTLTTLQLAIIQVTAMVLVFVGIMVGLSFFIKSVYFEQFMLVKAHHDTFNLVSGLRV